MIAVEAVLGILSIPIGGRYGHLGSVDTAPDRADLACELCPEFGDSWPDDQSHKGGRACYGR